MHLGLEGRGVAHSPRMTGPGEPDETEGGNRGPNPKPVAVVAQQAEGAAAMVADECSRPAICSFPVKKIISSAIGNRSPGAWRAGITVPEG